MSKTTDTMSPNHTSHARLHYATVAALVISNITTLGLGLLLSQAMGGGLGYFEYYNELNKIQATHAAPALITDDGGETPLFPSRKKGGAITIDPTASIAPIAPTFIAVSKQVTFEKGVSMMLIWKDNSSDETGFVIERAMTPINVIVPTTSIKFTRLDTTLANKTNPYVYYEDSGPFQEYTKYWYRVKAYRDTSESNYTTILTAELTDLTPPTVPTGLRMTSVNCSGLSISWSEARDNMGGVGVWGYAIEQDGAPGWSVYIATSTNSSGALYAYSMHTYRVAAFDREYNLSKYSDPLVINRPLNCPPVGPRNPIFADVTSKSLTVRWDDASNNEEVFEIQRALYDGISNLVYEVIGHVEADITTYHDVTLSPNQRYCYVIRANNKYGYSPYSQDVCVTTPSQ